MSLVNKVGAIFLNLKPDLKTIIVLFYAISFTTTALAYDVLMTTKAIKYKEKITVNNTFATKVEQLSNNCTALDISSLEKNSYTATHYIFKGSVLCLSDVKKYKKESVVFDFGILEIEQEGKVIFENNKYLRIRKQDGTVEKIYKNGQIE